MKLNQSFSARLSLYIILATSILSISGLLTAEIVAIKELNKSVSKDAGEILKIQIKDVEKVLADVESATESMVWVVKDNNTTEFTISPYARYTFAKSGIASFFVDGGISYGSYKEKHADAQSTFEIAVRPGIKVALSDKVALVSHIGSFGYKSIEDEYDKFGLNVDNSAIDFGMYFSF